MAGALKRKRRAENDRRGGLEGRLAARLTSGSARGRNSRASNDGDGDISDDDTNRLALHCPGRR
jgi:hypothetical protein